MDVYFTLTLLTLISQCKIAEMTILIILFLDFLTTSFWFRLQWCVDYKTGIALSSSAKFIRHMMTHATSTLVCLVRRGEKR